MDPAGPRRPPTLADVARLAGVSAMTVSRLINEQGKVSRPTADRVRLAMQQLRYRPNPLARGLAGGRTQTLGVVTFDTAQYGPASTLLGIERAARERGYGVAIAAIARPDHDALRDAVLSLHDHQVDGLVVIAPFVATAGALRDLEGTTPVVVAEAGHPGEAPIVGIDQGHGARLATRHLLGLGHRTVHHVAGPDDWIESRLRVAGWRDELASAALAAPPPIETDWSAAAGYAAGVRLVEQGDVTAVFAANDQIALGLLHAFHARGLRVPDEVSIVGFDDTPESAYYTPALTTVRQDFGRLGEVAVALLDQRVADPSLVVENKQLITPTLVVRSSTAAPRHRGRG
ncbi:LacI family DNA-binding transcriptional regulator [Kineosporia sp. A_224]|uniref:LacI family DNA-binding transcriptional regulator n=1 Tax=Kineosporia sp. A_224 TaxID=1962180 RepID=UPI000B4B0FD0|nr:LacI family DNA-binding transcriptional regulator [Kineosporia sp. A_224]